jgi:signal transduction histidine kinase
MTKILGTKWGAALVATVLVATLAFLVAKTSSRDFDFNAASVAIRDLKQVDAQWNVDVLSVDAGLENNFDKVVAPLPEIRRLTSRVRDLITAYAAAQPQAGPELTRRLDVYVAAMDQKIVSIERIKSSHAVVANSSRFLPVANNELVASIHASAMPAKEAQALERTLNGMLSAALSEIITPDPGGRGALASGAQAMRGQLAQLPREIAPKVQNLITHVDVLSRQRASSMQLLAQLTALPTVQALDSLQDQFMRELEHQLRVQRWYRLALIAYAFALLVLLAHVGRVLYEHYQSLNHSNQQLKAANLETQMLLIQSAKMSAIGQMVAGVAHEINSPLAYVKATFSMLRELITTAQKDVPHSTFSQQLSEPASNRAEVMDLREDDTTLKSLMEDINSLLDDGLHGIDQISELILTLKNFSRIDRAKRSDVLLSDGLNSALAIARYMLKRTVDVTKEYGDIPRVHCSPSQVNQVFLNIITNAAQAMAGRKERGKITLRTARHGEDMVRVEIQDNGSGIPKDVLPRIFDPFFTTKNPGEGTGAGLAICKQIIENHGGKILVDTQIGVGTTFTILLPIEDRQKPDPLPERDHELVGAC